jgi:hypothetical protein
MRKVKFALVLLTVVLAHLALAQNYCLTFHENCSDYVTVPHSDDFYFNNEFTVEAWFMVHGNQEADWVRIVSTYTATVTSGVGWQIGLFGPFNGIPYRLWGTYFLDTALSADFTPALDEWYHLAMSYDGSTARLFFNGDLVAEETMSITGQTNTAPLTIGGQCEDYLHRNLNGKIDEVRISNVCRYTGDFIPQTHFDPDVNTVALWHFDEGSGYTVYDATGNGHDGTIYGASWTAGGPQPIPDVSITLTYFSGSPVPASGGDINYALYVVNADTQAVDFDAWLAVEFEGGPPTTLVMRAFYDYQPGWTINRPQMTYPVPASWAAGEYLFCGRIGEMPDFAWTEDSFPFQKLGDGDASQFTPFPVAGAPNPFERIDSPSGSPQDYVVLNPHPNPFNPTTTLTYSLPAAAPVTLSIYDISGRLVTTLVDGYRDAGIHEVVFDASGLASGIYLAHIEAGGRSAVQKLMLMK